MFVLSGVTSDQNSTPVAVFSTIEQARDYVMASKLKNPNYKRNRIFRQSSLLRNYYRARFDHLYEVPLDPTLEVK